MSRRPPIRLSRRRIRSEPVCSWGESRKRALHNGAWSSVADTVGCPDGPGASTSVVLRSRNMGGPGGLER